MILQTDPENLIIFVFLFIHFSSLQIISTKHDHLCIQYLLHCHSLQVIFDISRYIKRLICIILAVLKTNLWKISVSSKNYCCITLYIFIIVYIFKFVDIFNVNAQFQFICLCISLFFKISFHIIYRFVYFTDLISCYNIFISKYIYIHHHHFRICGVCSFSSQTTL